jgi:inner membrane protein
MFMTDHKPNWWILILTVCIGIYFSWRLYRFYLLKDLESPKTSFSQWYLLFFLSFITHILLDSCTTFGTQLFYPFSNYRVAFNNIAVADPAYTIPFLICTIIFIFLKRGSKMRSIFHWSGIAISSAYMLFTIGNKIYVDQVFDKALAHRHIDAMRSRTSPTILNNLLWTCVAEDKEQYYVGNYSIFDSDPNLHYLNVIPKQDSLQQVFSAYPDYHILRWFSDGYLAISPTDSLTMLSDLRYGGITDTLKDYHDMVFNFKAVKENGVMTFSESREPFKGKFWDVLATFIHRMKGY